MNFINPSCLAEHWHEVRHGLEKIIDKTHETWIPEDVYADLKHGKAVLFKRGGAFIVVREYGGALDVWCAYSDGVTTLDYGFDWLKAHAKEHGFKEITMTSPRKGWVKHFDIVSINYKVKL